MTTLREAAKQALEAMDYLHRTGDTQVFDLCHRETTEALRAALVEDVMQKFTDVNQELMAALGCDHCNQPLYAAVKCRVCGRVTEPVQEPVAWRWGYRSVTTGEMDWRGYVDMAAHPNLRSPAIMQPLYTAPPQRKPLSDADLAKIWDDALDQLDQRDQLRFIARAIERAHGIGVDE